MNFIKPALFAGLLLSLAASFSQAATPERKDAVLSSYSSSSLATSTSVIVVDLSDIVNFPHKQTGEVSVIGVRSDIAKATTSSGTLKIGVVTRVSATNGDISWFWVRNFNLDASSPAINEVLSLPETFYRLKVNTGGTTPYFLTNDKTTNSTTFQTDVNLPTPVGNTAPGVGDIVAQLTNLASGSLNFTVQLLYDTSR